MKLTRRDWLGACLAMSSWPEVASALEHAHTSAASPNPKFETLDPETAREIEALAAQIIPSSDSPGAREAGVIYFIDRALSTFAADQREPYRAGMAQVQAKRRELFPDSSTIASLTSEQQMALMRAIEKSDFFELLRTHTVLGFLGDPSYGGNKNEIGWKQIGFENRGAFLPPFGFYDEQPDGEKK
jgi:gluconate 2-dehydrogenase gamma chain